MKQFITLLCLLVCAQQDVFANNKNIKKSQSSQTTSWFYHGLVLNGPAFSMAFQNNGNIQDVNGNWSIEYPKNSGRHPLFDAGFALSGYVEDSLRTSWLASASRIVEWQPGNVEQNGLPANPDNSRFKVYKISKNGNPFLNPDFLNWPVDLGADFKDLNQNGNYEPELGETPVFYGDEMFWYVINDGEEDFYRLKGSKPMGIEAQVSSFYFSEKGTELDHTVFVVYKFINKGGKPIKDMIFSLWSDPDLGDPVDDLVGVDSTRRFAYCYNETDNDNTYGISPPAFGFGLLQGPGTSGSVFDTLKVLGLQYPGIKNTGVGSFVKYFTGRPDLLDPSLTTEARNYQEGKKYNGLYYNPLTDGIGGLASDNKVMVHPGFPENSSGWRDAIGGDRRMMLNTNTFSMEPGDTQIVVVTYMVGQGTDNLNSISRLREIADQVKEKAPALFKPTEINLPVGFLNLTIVDKQNNPIPEMDIVFKSKAAHDSLFLSLKKPIENVLIPFIPGDYSLKSCFYNWGFIPDTTNSDFVITVAETLKVKITLDLKPGYFTTFIPKDTLDWTPVPYYPFSQKSNGWRIGGNIERPIGSLYIYSAKPGVYSLNSKSISCSGFKKPVFQFSYSGRLLGTNDTLSISLINSDGSNIHQVFSISAFSTNPPYSTKIFQFNLGDILPLPDSLKIQIKLKRNSTRLLNFTIYDLFVGESNFRPLGTAKIEMTDEQKPIKNGFITVFKNGNIVFNDSLRSEPILLPIGKYSVKGKSPVSWDFISFENKDSILFEINEGEQTTVQIPLKKEYGYFNGFDVIDTVNWIFKEPGDLAYPLHYWSQLPSGGASALHPGFIQTGTLSVSTKGQISFSSLKLNGLNFKNPVLSFAYNGIIKVTPGLDTLLYQVSFDDGVTWVKMGSETNLATAGGWKTKGFKLADFGILTDKMKIRFLLKKQSSNTCSLMLDEILIHEYTGVSVEDGEKKSGIGQTFTLLPAYPNPFNPSTTIRWIQPGNGSATIRVMNLLGQEVKVISAGARISGENEQTVSFNGLTSGIYFYRIDLNGKSSSTGKLMLLK